MSEHNFFLISRTASLQFALDLDSKKCVVNDFLSKMNEYLLYFTCFTIINDNTKFYFAKITNKIGICGQVGDVSVDYV